MHVFLNLSNNIEINIWELLMNITCKFKGKTMEKH